MVLNRFVNIAKYFLSRVKVDLPNERPYEFPMKSALGAIFVLIQLLQNQALAEIANPAIKFNHIVKFEKGLSKSQVAAAAHQAHLVLGKVLVPELNIFMVAPKPGMGESVLAEARESSSGNIKYIQKNQQISYRTIPNDPKFSSQWSFNEPELFTRAPKAWEITTGGKNKLGQDIVVAVADGGLDVLHNDLKENIWVNTLEIPDNGIDDDKNGYIDDVNGWDAFHNEGSVIDDLHGTHVAGVIGAKGNNGLGVTGVNWDVKIMALTSAGVDTSTVAIAYGYIIKQKKLWLESQGVKGANIVVANTSFGINKEDCKSQENALWNDLYNEMGSLGILSTVATANKNWDIDTVGDIPSGCESEFLVTVTNTTAEDKLYVAPNSAEGEGAAFGLKSVDLGAPGTNILSTIFSQGYFQLTGTSHAAPHVTGTIALMHAAASLEFLNLYNSSPSQGALALKQVLLNSTNLVPDLMGRTVTGGRLNIESAVKNISKFTK